MPSPVFVLGAPRSGTTLLRVMLAGHPQLFSPPEMVIAPFATMSERRKKLAERFWEKGGLRRTLMELHGIDVDAAKALEAEWESLTVPEVYQRLIDAFGERILVDKWRMTRSPTMGTTRATCKASVRELRRVQPARQCSLCADGPGWT